MKQNSVGAIILALFLAAPALAQDQVAANVGGGSPEPATATEDTTSDAEVAAASFVLRPVGQQALNLFEAPKFTGPFDGIKVTLGGAFTLGFQALDRLAERGLGHVQPLCGSPEM